MVNPIAKAEFSKEAKAGAVAGLEYAKKWGQKPLKMAKINDYEWLEEHYVETQKPC